MSAAPERLFCLPHAGGTAAAVSAWLAPAVPGLEVVGLEYPGHGRRMAEPFARSVAELIADLVPRVRGEGGRIGLFGHSLGAIVAFELALALQASGEIELVGLAVSGCAAPGSWPPGIEVELSDEVLFALVLAGGGTELFDEEELRDLFLPILRADMEVARRYAPAADRKAGVTVVALGGDRDPIAPPRAMEGWRAFSEAFCGVRAIEGDHFFLRERHGEVGDAIEPLFASGR